VKLLELCTGVEELVHPLTGEPLHPMTLPSGRVVWPILGGAPDDDDDDDTDDDDSDDDDDEEDESDDEDDESKSKSTKPKEEDDDKTKRIRELTADKIRFRKERNALRTEIASVRNEVNQLKNKGKPELETVTRERDEAVKRAEAAEGTLRAQAVSLAFYSITDFKWKNPSDALELARKDLKDVDVEDGEADRDAVREVVEKLAQSKSYLLEDTEDSKKPKGRNDSKGDPEKDTGAGGTGKRNPKGAQSRAALAKKYPALAR
jgi:hypothetical protein